jgi:hypothetical protein
MNRTGSCRGRAFATVAMGDDRMFILASRAFSPSFPKTFVQKEWKPARPQSLPGFHVVLQTK